MRHWFALLLVLPILGTAPLFAAADAVVFIANGSGDLPTVTAALSGAVAETGAPLRLETFDWSHGFGRYLTDHVDHANQVAQGRRLAGSVVAYRQTCPAQAIYLVGHSAGCAVLLAAAESLPPGSVDRIVLLAPSVSANYDLRPALCASREGIDVFYSRRDLVMLAVGVGLAGTADRHWEAAAGRVGFRPVTASSCDAVLYAKLRQHAWDRCVAWTGDHGGHYGTNRVAFARAYLLPLLTPCFAPAGP